LVQVASTFPVSTNSSSRLPREEIGKRALFTFLISNAIGLSIEKREHERELIVRLFMELLKRGMLSSELLERGLRQTLTLLADLEMDSPLAGRQVADIIAALMVQGGLRGDKNSISYRLNLDHTLKGSKLSAKQFMEIIDQRTYKFQGEQLEEWVVLDEVEIRELEEERLKYETEELGT